MGNPSALARLADAVADGTAVDWDQVQAASPDQDRPVVEQLRVLAALSTLHRTTEPQDTRETDVPVTAADVDGTSRQWGSLLVLGELGRGSQGRVYRAIDTRLQREVALKIVRVSGDGSGGAHLLAEARLLARVRHPNVVTVYGADRVGDEIGLWMELVKGQTLASRVARDGPFSADEAAVVGSSLCRALAAVHQAGLLHRDVKAQNVMREAGGRVVLMDFGAGRDLQDPSTGRRAIGTPVYLPPEVLSGGPATVRSDIYSVGVLLFFLTTRRFPVSATSLIELKERHERREASLLRDLRPDLPESFVAVVARATDPNPDQRFESAGGLEEALTHLAAGSSAPARVGRDVRLVGRRPPGVGRRAAIAVVMVTAAVILAVAGAWRGSRVFRNPVETPSIAVLPLRNLSGDASKEYLADSLTDVLITHLTKIKAVRVLSFPAVARFKGQSKTPSEAGAALGVRYLLSGAITLEGPLVRTTIQLIDTKSGAIPWAEAYIREPSALLEQQAEIVRTVAARLQLDLPENVISRIDHRRATTPDAQDAYLRGIADSSADTLASAASAVRHLERAVGLDPAFGDAWASLSLARVRLANQAPGPGRDAQYAQARQDALAALERDPGLGRAYAALGTIRFYFDWDWNGADAAFQRAIELTPGDGFAHQRYSMFLAAADRLPAAIEHGRAAQTIEPLVPLRSTNLGTLYYYARRYDEAVTELRRALELSPGFAVAHTGLCRVYSATGNLDTAADHCRAAVEKGSPLVGLLGLARVFAQGGRRNDVDRVMAEVRSQPQGPFISPDSIALIHAAMGDSDVAFEWLEKAAAAKSGNLLWIRVDPRFDPLRKDRRLAAIVSRVSGTLR